MVDTKYAVRASHCDHRAPEEEIYDVLRRTTEPLTRSWERLGKARRILLKFNMIKRPQDMHYFRGRRRELVDDAVCRAVLRLLRERTSAQLVAIDTFPYGNGHRIPQDFNYRHLLEEFGVAWVDSSLPPFAWYEVPGGGAMFERYRLNACIGEADEFVSVAKMKNHGFMGITLCTKNLFGLPPMIPPEGRTRSYYHHIIRLSYLLHDLARIADPCLNIVDALTGQSRREWGGEGRTCDALMAGDHPIATDACGAFLMGCDPASDWPTPPFRRDRNHLLIAAQRGYGTVDLAQIDFQSEVSPPLAEFDSDRTDSSETVSSWRRTTCEQGLLYRQERSRFLGAHAGEFIYLQDGEVVWHGPDPTNLGSRRQLSGDRKASALWLKYVDPEEREGERFEPYEECLRLAS
ncbi:MAG: DUF362 domain-containing protein [Gemmatimonadota bacterium]